MAGRTRDGEKCPHKIVDDFGVTYSLGVVLGTLTNGVRGRIEFIEDFLWVQGEKNWRLHSK